MRPAPYPLPVPGRLPPSLHKQLLMQSRSERLGLNCTRAPLYRPFRDTVCQVTKRKRPLALLIQRKTGQNCFILNHLGSDTPKNGKKHSKFANFKELFCSEHASPGDYISVLAMPK